MINKKEHLEKLVELYCDINNMFFNIKPSLIERLKNKDVDDILLNKQAIIKDKIICMIDEVNEYKTNLSPNTIPFKIDKENILKQIKKI